jgi:hypothetical protein
MSFPRFLETNVRVLSRIGHDRLLSNSISSLFICLYDNVVASFVFPVIVFPAKILRQSELYQEPFCCFHAHEAIASCGAWTRNSEHLVYSDILTAFFGEYECLIYPQLK